MTDRFVDGLLVGEIYTTSRDDRVDCNGFEFVSGADTPTRTRGPSPSVAGRDPVTPLVVRVHGPDDFTVVAMGDPRSDYAAGGNRHPFSDGSAPVLVLEPGETLASGFMDALPDGSGGGLGHPIPKTSDVDPVNGDELWYTGGPQAAHSGSIALGQPPLPSPAPAAEAGPQREYRYSVRLTVVAGQGAAPVPMAPWAAAVLGALLASAGLRAASRMRR